MSKEMTDTSKEMTAEERLILTKLCNAKYMTAFRGAPETIQWDIDSEARIVMIAASSEAPDGTRFIVNQPLFYGDIKSQNSTVEWISDQMTKLAVRVRKLRDEHWKKETMRYLREMEESIMKTGFESLDEKQLKGTWIKISDGDVHFADTPSYRTSITIEISGNPLLLDMEAYTKFVRNQVKEEIMKKLTEDLK